MKWATNNRKKMSWAASLVAHLLVLGALAYAPGGDIAEPLSIEVVLSMPELPDQGPESPVLSTPQVRRDTVSVKSAAPVRPVVEEALPGPGPAVEAAAAPPPSGGGSPVAAARELEASERYALEIRSFLERKKVYPSAARRLGKQGRVVIRFTLRRDGTIAAAEITESSSHELLNEAARNLVKQIDGFRPFPQEITRTSWEFLVPVEYRL